MRRVRICAPNVWAISKEDIDFAHPIFGPYFMYCAPNLRLLPPPLLCFVEYVACKVILTSSDVRRIFSKKVLVSSGMISSLEEAIVFIACNTEL